MIRSFSMKKKNTQISLASIQKNNSKYKININIGNSKKYFYINSNFENDIKNLLAALSIMSIFKENQTKGVNGFVDANHNPPTPHLDGSSKPSYTWVSRLVN